MGTNEENIIENFVCFIYGGAGSRTFALAPAPTKKYRLRNTGLGDGSQVFIGYTHMLGQWAETWGMAFNTKKCKVMHMGRSNGKHQYVMGSKALEGTEEERDIGVMVT